nr:MAG TPA: hypothetical protein [Caudoviricetes sp.]
MPKKILTIKLHDSNIITAVGKSQRNKMLYDTLERRYRILIYTDIRKSENYTQIH